MMVWTVYGYNTIEQRKTLWEQLQSIAPQITKPWLICGDFNTMLYLQDRMSESYVLWAEIKDFSDCYHNLLVNELLWNGEYYTWSNK